MANVVFPKISLKAAHDLFKSHPKTFVGPSSLLIESARYVKAISELGGWSEVRWLPRNENHRKLLAKHNQELEGKFVKAAGVSIKPGSLRLIWAPKGTSELPYDELDNQNAVFDPSKITEVPFEIKAAVFLTNDNVKAGVICGTRSFADSGITLSDWNDPKWTEFRAVEPAGNLCPGAEGSFKASFGKFVDRKQGNDLDRFFLEQFLEAYKSLPTTGPFLFAHHSAGSGVAAPMMLELNAKDKGIQIVSVGFGSVVSVDELFNGWLKKQGHTAIAVCNGFDPVSRIHGPWGIWNGIVGSASSLLGLPPPDFTASRAAEEMAASNAIHIGQVFENNRDAKTVNILKHTMANYLETVVSSPQGYSTNEGKAIEDFFKAAMAYK